MRQRFQFLRRLTVATLAWCAVSRAGAQLVTTSPFLPVAPAASATAPTAGAPLEFRGRIDMPPDGLKVRIYDPNRKIGAWLKVNERDPNFDCTVKQFDASRDTVTVEYRGQTMVLAQREGKVASSGAVPNIAMGAIPMPMAVTQAATLNPTPADEQRRLEAVAAEVARRRQLREQAADPVNPNAAVPPPQNPQNPQAAPNGARGGARGP